jgi:integrase
LLPARARVKKAGHHAALSYDDVGGFMSALRLQGNTSARALEFAILTAARTGEVIGATWNEFDLDKRIWVVPGERMKANREHRVPLSSAVVSLLEDLKKERQGDFIFNGARAEKPLSNMALLMTLRRMKRTDLTTHGFRSTFRDWCAERTVYPAEVAEMALAHAVGDKVEAAYRRGDLFEKRIQLMQDWADFCAVERQVANSGNVASSREGV